MASSKHFTPSEFACPHCGVSLARQKLVTALEALRLMVGHPIRIVSGYRCPVHNERVGGAKDSMHMYGAAVDVPRGTCSVHQAERAGFVGIGTKNSLPVHLDVRDGRATRWTY